MAAYIRFVAGHLEGSEYRHRGGNRLTSATGFRDPPLHVTDIASLEVATEESVQRLGGSLGGAALGGLVFGRFGALAGAAIGGRERETVAVVEFRDGTRSLARLNAPMMELVRAHLFRLKENPDYAPYPCVEPKRSWRKALLAAAVAVLLLAAISGLGHDRDREAGQAAVSAQGAGAASDGQAPALPGRGKEAGESALHRLLGPSK